jgi:hypothetical protein
MPSVRFPGATAREVTAAQLADGSERIPTQVYIVLLNDSATVGEDSRALLERYASEFGEWVGHHAMFGGKMISGTLSQAQVAWLLSNDGGVIQVIEADGVVSLDDGPGMVVGGGGMDVGGGSVGGGMVFTGGSPNFIMVDDERVQLNADTLAALTAAASPYAQIELLQALQGKIFNLANTVPDDMEGQVREAVSAAVMAAAASVAAEPNRSLAQNLIDVAVRRTRGRAPPSSDRIAWRHDA